MKLGDKVRDVITGFEGIVTGHAEYVTGCDQYLLQPQIKAEAKDATFPEPRWFDENRLSVVELHDAATWRTDRPKAVARAARWRGRHSRTDQVARGLSVGTDTAEQQHRR